MDPIEALKTIHFIACDPRHCSEFAFRDIDELVRDAIDQPDDPILPAKEFHGSAWAWTETMEAHEKGGLQWARELSLEDLARKALGVDDIPGVDDLKRQVGIDC